MRQRAHLHRKNFPIGNLYQISIYHGAIRERVLGFWLLGCDEVEEKLFLYSNLLGSHTEKLCQELMRIKFLGKHDPEMYFFWKKVFFCNIFFITI